ncbi:conserved domain protein [Ruminococcus albus 8]|uniref:Conserved domain protein n=1 Tax=Ruminococcus albus 8 TaxID=246199 RepID=E9SDM6_RUMAL|nr:conserved domain protein [Ruminococcus albus 8]
MVLNYPFVHRFFSWCAKGIVIFFFYTVQAVGEENCMISIRLPTCCLYIVYRQKICRAASVIYHIYLYAKALAFSACSCYNNSI